MFMPRMIVNREQNQRRAGFTLVELLVVIGIIALLISILLPSLQKARRAATAVACQSNMKQVYVAFVMYAQQNKGALIPNGVKNWSGASWATTNIWSSYVVEGKYLGENGSKVMGCPGNDRDTEFSTGSVYGSPMRDPGYWGTPGFYPKMKTKYRWEEIGRSAFSTDPARFTILIDSVRNYPDGPGQDLAGKSFFKGDAEHPSQSIACRHSKRANVLFVDGHLEAMLKTELINYAPDGLHRISGTWATVLPQNVVESE
jgi:prepilin-type processing-associated H-X9-DG protein/prepilin-type N-terminal cleavage/methylation domain-containing protein